jgi:hypothetical protein
MLSAAAIYQTGYRCHLSSTASDNFKGFLNPPAAGNHVFDYDESVGRGNFEAAPEHESAGIVFFSEDMGQLEGPGDFVSDDQAAESGRNDASSGDATEFFGEQCADFGCNIGVLEQERALEKLAAMQAGTEHKMAIEQCFGLAEEGENFGIHKMVRLRLLGLKSDGFDFDLSASWKG